MIKINDNYTNVDIDKVCMYFIIYVWYCVVVLERVVSFDPWVQTQKADEGQCDCGYQGWPPDHVTTHYTLSVSL